MPFDFQKIYDQQALSYSDFLAKNASERDLQKWSLVYDRVQFSNSQRQMVEGFVREMHLLVMAGTWCGDCAVQCPIIQKIGEANPRLHVRFIDRDANLELAAELTICGAPRIPQTMMFDEDFNPISRVGEKTLSQYRVLAARLAGASCGTGLITDQERNTVTQEWCDQFEYAQHILRLSPRLRERHGD
ncbi:MAG: thioredoxin family protein [Pirellulaceae bacterium]